ncbi:FKBP-type peptidyl-prolyl cis-trans isomerase [Desulfobaculum bizertense]|uniref:Peptidyl-prolyl cis-trans isomerase n=1 Tax=Desulfobaculum bizertense DSM 18034 TaxID=1121442 RepID=A0A1T4VZZ9_9BACT|nr:peptidylprolyl isomerase [Desulfobaculum bizertense]UIJ37040.1 peptidylprolyl isomerase [Desulfobaculum bizertense]SKA70405.1 peptidylprolyl isomerase [Desulfobaculum bizertense DSM 18034]
MATAKSGDTVKIHYTGTLSDGTEFDSSREREPLEFALGAGAVIPGFDAAVEGMEVGEKKTVNIPCAEAYGERVEQAIAVVPREHFPEDLKPEVGMSLQVPREDGTPIIVTVTEISEEAVTLDGNHPLAGQDLTFEIELVEIG